MKKFVFLLVLSCISNITYGTEFERGVNAYLAGDYETALQMWRPLADQGDSSAMFNIGVMYSQGLGVLHRPNVAFKWYQRAAEKGYAPAQFNLGLAYRRGTGVQKNVEQAIHWWQKSALQGHLHAQYNLGTLYWLGEGVAQDTDKAIAWFKSAADSGNANAIQILARIGEEQAGVQNEQEVSQQTSEKETEDTAPQESEVKAAITKKQRDRFKQGQTAFASGDYQQALQMWRPLAKAGIADAQYRLGQMYQSGLGLKKNQNLAIQWYQRAAEQGQVSAQFNLGLLYIDGQDVEKNEGLGWFWVQSAADKQEPRALEYIKSDRQNRTNAGSDS